MSKSFKQVYSVLFIVYSVLFAIYIDELLEELKVSGLGCYVGHVIAAAFGMQALHF